MFGRPYEGQKSSRQGVYDLIILDHEKIFFKNIFNNQKLP